jgi:GxxExxY protein
VYRKALIIVLLQLGLKASEEASLKVFFRGKIVGDFYADILVEERLIVELKAVKSLTPEHEA